MKSYPRPLVKAFAKSSQLSSYVGLKDLETLDFRPWTSDVWSLMSNVFQSLGLLVLRISIKRTFDRNTNVARISIVATCFPLRGKRRKQYVQANWIFRRVATLKYSETPFRTQRDGACQRPSNNAQYTVVLPPQPSGQLPRWGAKTFRHFSLSPEVNKSLY